QLEKARKESEAAFEIEDKQAREERLLEINEAFDQSINDPDYARKLFLIENCIYGVDIQPIATQISKLRFFISLVVEQKVNAEKNNFGIRPLPNLETKFVAANTLIGIKKDGGLFETDEVKKLENELKIVRHKIFSLKSKERKIAWREKDKELREKLSAVLKNQGLPLDAAEKLAKWDPYDQNASSPFFDSEWMFGIKEGFDIVIGNPPYVTYKGKEKVDISTIEFNYLLKRYRKSAEYKVNSYALFIENASDILNEKGNINFIIPSTILQNEYLKNTRNLILKDNHLETLVVFKNSVFEAVTDSIIVILSKKKAKFITQVLNKKNIELSYECNEYENWDKNIWLKENGSIINLRASKSELEILSKIDEGSQKLDKLLNVYVGIVASGIKQFLSNEKHNDNYKPYILGRDIDHFKLTWNNRYLNYLPELLHSNTDSSVYNQPFKLLVRKTGNRLLSVLDNNQYFTDQSIYNLYPKNQKIGKPELAAINAILNSYVLNFYFNKKMITNPDVFPYIKGIHLKELPLKIDNNYNLVLEFLSDLAQYLGNKIFKEVINALVFNLYFPDHMKERGIDVLEYVEQDINEVMQGREFEKLSDAEKEQVIEDLHTKWSHPDNEVVKRMAMFKEKSPDILKPILES
ncbi:MAG TPA: hypothetical protein DIT47_05845, partial [Flavobacteriaceae bacterium]|nr:hypothetical protein [Flavobacteriaceae bacterium]